MAARSQQVYVPWSRLWVDVLLLGIGFLVLFISYVADYMAGCSQWFHRSGAVSVLLSGMLAYYSLAKHYQKFFNIPAREGDVVTTSRNQKIIDRWTLVLSVIGTLVWGYGDMLFNVACK